LQKDIHLGIKEKTGMFTGENNHFYGKKHTPESRKKISDFNRTRIGEKHPRWAGKNISYRGIHKWVYAVLGQPKQCSLCGLESENGRKFHWANISKQYRRDTRDWVRLCVRCHFAFDGVYEKRRKVM
jgi:hypothetical protein